MINYKIYWSNSQLWYIVENADGTVIANYNRNFKPYSRVPYTNVASAVKSAGGLDAFRARLITPEEAEARLTAEAAAKAERAAQKAVDAAKENAAAIEARLRLAEVEKAGAIAPTENNIRNLLLSVQHNCAWPLPQFAVGYSVNRYDCGNGKIAATAVFDTPVLVNGQLTTRVCLGAPRGHLEKYTRR
nr:MAG TPA: hypothetical protein [Bacteriophage sp.]